MVYVEKKRQNHHIDGINTATNHNKQEASSKTSFESWKPAMSKAGITKGRLPNKGGLMIFISTRLSPYYHQMTLEELLFGDDTSKYVVNYNDTNTRTYAREHLTYEFRNKYNTYLFWRDADRLMSEYRDVYECNDLHQFYDTFYIPKKSKGLRKIDAPIGRLKEAQYKLRDIIEALMTKDSFGREFGATYHTAAYAYIKGRSPKKCMEKHLRNKSRWFLKLDFSNFFGSTTPDFLNNQLMHIAPFCFIGTEYLSKVMSIAFLDGGLPQGTPLSPLLTNIMMIPIDYELTNTLRSFEQQSYVYTRYADDILITSEYNFSFRKIEEVVKGVLDKYSAPFTIKPEKTRYGSNAGSNWNLGMMYNADFELTIGHEKKKQFKAMLSNYIQDRMHGNKWDKSDVQVLSGLMSYYTNIEGDKIKEIVNRLSEKYGQDIAAAIKYDLKQIAQAAY